MKRPILTPCGRGEIENIYLTDIGYMMVKVWYEKDGIFINWKIDKLIDYYTKLAEKDGSNIKR